MQIYAQKIQCYQAREHDEVQTTPPQKKTTKQKHKPVSTQLLVSLWANNLTGSRQQDQGDCKFKGQGSEK